VKSESERRIGPQESQFLNILRGLAIVGVIVMHSAQSIQTINVQHISEFVTQILYLGRYGVEVFFFLSGWLLAALYGFDDRSIAKGYTRRRLARIYPLWIIFLFIYFIQGRLFRTGGFFQAEHANFDLDIVKNPLVIIFLALTFTLFLSSNLWNSVIPGSWSIQSEICHYLLFPFIRRHALHKVMMAMAMINLLSIFVLLGQSEIKLMSPELHALVSTWLRLGLYSTFSFFLAGVMAQRYFRRNEIGISEVFWNSKSFFFFVLTSFCVNCPQGVQIEAIGYLLCNLLLASSLANYPKLGAFFSFLGQYSYFLYFSHFLVIQFVISFLSSRNMTFDFEGDQIIIFCIIFIFTLTCSLAFALPSYRFIEKPLIRYFR